MKDEKENVEDLMDLIYSYFEGTTLNEYAPKKLMSLALAKMLIEAGYGKFEDAKRYEVKDG